MVNFLSDGSSLKGGDTVDTTAEVVAGFFKLKITYSVLPLLLFETLTNEFGSLHFCEKVSVNRSTGKKVNKIIFIRELVMEVRKVIIAVKYNQ